MTRSTAPRCALAIALMLALLPAASAAQTRKKPAAVPAAKEEKKPAPVARGSLYAIVLGPGPAWKKGQPLKGPGLDQHRAYWKKLHAEGKVASAGPLGDDTGLILLRARGQSDANAAILADPAVKARLFRGVARPYTASLASPEVLMGSAGKLARGD